MGWCSAAAPAGTNVPPGRRSRIGTSAASKAARSSPATSNPEADAARARDAGTEGLEGGSVDDATLVDEPPAAERPRRAAHHVLERRRRFVGQRLGDRVGLLTLLVAGERPAPERADRHGDDGEGRQPALGAAGAHRGGLVPTTVRCHRTEEYVVVPAGMLSRCGPGRC